MRLYTIFGSPNDYWIKAYKDISKVKGAQYLAGFLPEVPTIIRKIHSAHCTTSFAVKKRLPLRRVWFSKYLPMKYCDSYDYVFVFFNEWAPVFQNGYIDFLRKKYPGCKCILHLCDIDLARRLDMAEEKKRFDHIMVFERNFAKEHQIEYYPLVFSDYRRDVQEEKKTIDLLFVGWAKGRYKLLKQIYDQLTEFGVNCQFYLTKIDEEVTQESGIRIVDWVPYTQYIELLKKAKCLLDIVPQNTDCNTLRVNEAMSYKCKLLTNNIKIVNEEFYNARNISIFCSPSEIDISFLLKPYTSIDYDGYIAKMTPQALIQHLDRVLFEKGEYGNE